MKNDEQIHDTGRSTITMTCTYPDTHSEELYTVLLEVLESCGVFDSIPEGSNLDLEE